VWYVTFVIVKNFFANVLISALAIVIFFGGLEFAQRVRYYFKNDRSKYYLTYGFAPKNANSAQGKNASFKSIDTYMEVSFTKFDGYALGTPGSYQRTCEGETFTVYINKLGFRGEEIEIDKKDYVYRIALLGGSSVQGLESPDDATIASVLQNLINENKASFLTHIGKNKAEVINAGIIANASYAILPMLDKEIFPLTPDLIIIYSAFNDYRHAGVFGGVGTFGANIIRRLMGKTWFWFYNHSLLFVTVYEKAAVFSKKKMPLHKAEKVFANYRQNMKAIIEKARDNSMQVTLVKQPLFIEDFPVLQNEEMMDKIERCISNDAPITYEEAYYWMQSRQLDTLADLSEEYKLALVDPIPEIERHNKETLFHDIVHLRKEGNALLARIIFENLAENFAR
jgi:lysophospholipase L1-like esterase